jgi:hypothetical protein
LSRRIIAVDPGSSSGAIAIKYVPDGFSGYVETANMPDSPLGILKYFMDASTKLNDKPEVVVVCEDVGSSMPGNAARAAATFARHRGHLEMIFISLGLPVVWVRPAKWMKELLGEKYPKGIENKLLRKTYIYETMLKTYPSLKVTKRRADALAILTWYLTAQRKEKI